MGSAGVKVISVVRDVTDAYVHAGGQYEWDSAAPVAVARAAGLFTLARRRLAAALQPGRRLPARPDRVPPRARRADRRVRQAARHRLSRAMIRHVLLDADGVVQHMPGGWVAAVERHLDVDAEEFWRPRDARRAGLPAW